MYRILVVDDEPSILTLLDYSLQQQGYLVDTATDGQTAYQMIKEANYDFIILDVMLPHMSGMDVCRRIRQKGIDTPVLMLTARADEYDKIIGLELGADDYMTKPFSPNEVLARIKAILRRSKSYHDLEDNNFSSYKVKDQGQVESPLIDDQASQSATSTTLSFGDLTFYLDKVEVFLRDRKLDLTPKEYELLLYMANHMGKTLSREQLLSQVWQFDYMGETRIVDVHISKLREKIEINNKNPQYLLTVRGFGYRFEVPQDA
ncbi:TPA: response regulator transcription factor [Streptococcus suis]